MRTLTEQMDEVRDRLAHVEKRRDFGHDVAEVFDDLLVAVQALARIVARLAEEK